MHSDLVMSVSVTWACRCLQLLNTDVTHPHKHINSKFYVNVHGAEGVPERDTKHLIAYARTNNKVLIGPATVGGIQVGSIASLCNAVTCNRFIRVLHRIRNVEIMHSLVLNDCDMEWPDAAYTDKTKTQCPRVSYQYTRRIC